MKKRILTIVKYVIFLVLIVFLHLYNNHIITFVMLLMTLFFPVISITAFYVNEKKIEASLEFSSTTVQRNQATELLLTLHNVTVYPFSRERLSVRLQHNFISNDYVHEYPFSLPPGREVTCRVPVSFGICGCYQAQGIQLESTDFGGFVSKKRPISMQAEVIILPQLLPLKEGLEQLQADEQTEEIVEEHEIGQDASEILNIREYREGDRLQTIHWKLSAKEQQLMIKEFARVSGNAFQLFVDYAFQNIRHLDPFFDLLYSFCDYMLGENIPLEVCWRKSSSQLLETQEITDFEKIRIMLLKLFYEQPEQAAGTSLNSYIKKELGSQNILVLTARQYKDASFRLLFQHKGSIRIYQVLSK